jgi:phosphatidylglycerophosphate synthase
MGDESDLKADCYSAGERAGMVRTQELRGRLFKPVLEGMSRCAIAADHVTLLAFVVGLSFCPLYFWSKPLAFAALGLHALLDGLDGPLARHQGVASRRGSLTDTMSDQIVVVATTLTLMGAHAIDVFAGGCYIFLYTLAVIFAMVRNALRVPYSWLVRPRLFVYVWFLIEAYLLPGTLDYVLWGFNALLALKVASGFLRIRGRV